MIPKDSTHTLNLLKTIYQKYMWDLLSKKKNVGVKLQKINQVQVLNKDHSQLTLNLKQEHSQFKCKLGQFQLVQHKILPKKFSQIFELDTNQSNLQQIESKQSLNIISYISISKEKKSSSRIKNRKFKFNSLEF